MRTFQFSDAKSHKFWNIDVQGTRFTVTFGKVGTAGQSQTKALASAEKAQAAADKLIREKTAKGYRETTVKAAASPEEALERAVIADPDDATAWSALADYLVEQGDPRGEFMQVQRALDGEELTASDRKQLRAREKELLKAHAKEWVGDWADRVTEPFQLEILRKVDHTGGRKYEFKRGLLATANFRVLTVAAARAFVKAPQTRFVRELFIGDLPEEEAFEPGPDVPEGVDAYHGAAHHVLVRWPHLRHVRRVQFGWMVQEEYRDSCGFSCHLRGLPVFDYLKQMPDVEEVLIFAHLHNAEPLVALPMPKLRVLQLYHCSSYPLQWLAKNPSLTKLTHLLCHPHAHEPGQPDDPWAYIRLPQLKAVCRSQYLTSLTHLRLRLTDFGDRGAREIVDSGVLKRLKVLDLRHGCITDKGVRLLAGCPDLRNLERLDLSHNAIDDEGINAIRATGVPAEFGFQHEPLDPEDFESAMYLFQGDIE
jgi:uncharacterized protein (TIGR02996 family)